MKKKILLWALAVSLMLSLAACGKSEAAKAVDDQIAAIGEVTLESEAAISEAEAAVDALSEEDRKQLDNTDQLEQARADYEALVLAGKVSEVEDAIAPSAPSPWRAPTPSPPPGPSTTAARPTSRAP